MRVPFLTDHCAPTSALQFEEAERSQWRLVYVKELAEELKEENRGTRELMRPASIRSESPAAINVASLLPVPIIDASLADRILLARLSLDPQGDVMSDDGEKLQVLASLPSDVTSWDYLCQAYRRCRAEESQVKKVSRATRHCAHQASLRRRDPLQSSAAGC